MKKILIAVAVCAASGLTGASYGYNAIHNRACLSTPFFAQVHCAAYHLTVQQFAKLGS